MARRTNLFETSIWRVECGVWSQSDSSTRTKSFCSGDLVKRFGSSVDHSCGDPPCFSWRKVHVYVHGMILVRVLVFKNTQVTPKCVGDVVPRMILQPSVVFFRPFSLLQTLGASSSLIHLQLYFKPCPLKDLSDQRHLAHRCTPCVPLFFTFGQRDQILFPCCREHRSFVRFDLARASTASVVRIFHPT